MSIRIKSGLSVDILEVDSNNEFQTILPTVDGSNNSLIQTSGYFNVVSEIDDGTITGSRYLKQLDSSQDYRLRVGKDKIIWQDKFNYTTLNSSNYSILTSSEVIDLSSGYLRLNSTNDAGSTRYAIVETFRNFTNFETYPLYGDIVLSFDISFDPNNIIEFGFGIVSADSEPTDGVMFRISGGTTYGITINNSNVSSVSLTFTPTPTEFNHYLIIFNSEKAEFWIDNLLYGTILVPTGLGSMSSSNSLPLFFRTYNKVGVVTPPSVWVSQATVSLGDMVSNKGWETTNIGSGLSSINYPPSYLSGQTANITNSTSPSTASTLSNTTTPYTTLGGEFIYSATTSGEIDYILFGFQNPSGSTTTSGKNLIVTGIKINTFNGSVAAGANVTTLQWGMAFGSTDISLGNTDSLTTGSRAPRRIAVGCQTFVASAAAFTRANNPIDVKFKTPYIVEPGTYLHVFFKTPIAPAPAASQYFRGYVLINGYFE